MLRGPWLVTRYADCEAILRDARFSADERHLPAFVQLQAKLVRRQILSPEEAGRAPSLLRLDPPEHTRQRRFVSRYFTPRRIDQLRAPLEQLAELRMRRARERGSMDVIRELAQPLPFLAIATALGIPESDRGQLRAWSDELVLTLGPTTLDTRRRSIESQRSFRAYLRPLVRARAQDPGDDLVSELVRARDLRDPQAEHEVLETCTLLLVAGHETTSNWIGNSIGALLTHPEQLAWLRTHPERTGEALEELLRFDPPVQLTSRIALEDVVLSKRKIRRGDEVVLVLGAANRDPEVYPDPDSLDLSRNPERQLSFGAGIHFCLGASLARLEAEIALNAWLRHANHVTLMGPVERRTGMVLRGLRELRGHWPEARSDA